MLEESMLNVWMIERGVWDLAERKVLLAVSSYDRIERLRENLRMLGESMFKCSESAKGGL
jgi:hypothetical protein